MCFRVNNIHLTAAVFGAGLIVPAAGAQEPLEEIRVSGNPISLEQMADAYGMQTISADELAEAPELRLDEKLSAMPAFSLFRRSGSQLAHPTAQGVTLRSVGPNGAGRTLVLVDGVPAGDPFGGWVNWARLPVVDIDSVHVVKGGGTGPWGSGALAGTLVINTDNPDENQTKLAASLGSFETVDVSASSYFGDSNNGLNLSGNYYTSDGAYIIDSDQRGDVDTRAEGEGGWFRLKGKVQVAENYSLSFSGGFSDDDRLNGTPYTGNGTRVWDAAVGLERKAVSVEDWAFEMNAYIRDQEFYSRFSAVADDRNSENPANNQYSVPSTAKGVNFVMRRQVKDGWLIELGADYRHTKGATNEQYFFSGGQFLRERNAGGSQALSGFFAESTLAVTDTVDLSFGARLDHWRNTDGFRTETNLETEQFTRNEAYANNSKWLPGGRAGFAWQTSEKVKMFGSVYSGVRAPSLNELYRPFRIGSDITEANPALEIERLYGAELGLSYESEEGLSLRASYFRNWLRDGVGNVTITTDGGFYAPLSTFVPFGGSLSQRLNVDRITVDGIEVDASLAVTDQLTFEASYFWNNARISKNVNNPATEGNRLAQTPEHRGYVALSLTPTEKWLVRVSADLSSKQYDDDGNSRVLGGYLTVDAYVSYQVSENTRLYAAGINLTDREVLTGMRSNGLRSVAEPASWRIGFQSNF